MARTRTRVRAFARTPARNSPRRLVSPADGGPPDGAVIHAAGVCAVPGIGLAVPA